MAAMRLRTACRHPGCPATVSTPGYCDKHKRQAHQSYARQRPDQEEQAIYRSQRWRNLSISKRNETPLCERCERAGRITPAVLVHHIKPIRDGGDPWAWDNLEALCASCHRVDHG